MPSVENVRHIGMRRALALANLTTHEQISLISDGLPTIFRSASELLDSARELSSYPRSAEIIRNHACEELAKILILLDIIRCPESKRNSVLKPMIRCFYSHLSRIIYIEAQKWKPVDAQMLQSYINTHRKTYSLEGNYGEYIIPNDELFRRESSMYADIICEEDNTLYWNDPQKNYRSYLLNTLKNSTNENPIIWKICNSLNNFGAFSETGLHIISSIWGIVDFRYKETHKDAENLTKNMIHSLAEANLISNGATTDQSNTLFNSWQMPMYSMYFSPIETTMQQLQDERAYILSSEI